MIGFLKTDQLPNQPQQLHAYLGFLDHLRTFAIILLVGGKGLQYDVGTEHRDMLQILLISSHGFAYV